MLRATTRYDDLYIHLLVELPQGWSWASGKEPSNLVTQISRASNAGADDGVYKFAFPFELVRQAFFPPFFPPFFPHFFPLSAPFRFLLSLLTFLSSLSSLSDTEGSLC